MATENKSTGSGEIDQIRQIVNCGRYSDNFLMPVIEKLLSLYQQMEKHTDRVASENRQLRSQMVEIVRSLDLGSRIDGMTGLVNRRGIMEKIEQEITRARRHTCPITILLIDIDDFEKINNTHGYNDGDDVLVEVARLLRGIVRNEDICSRWGGEEFLILLPETNLEGALPVAGKVLESIAMSEFKVGNPGIRITASIGVSVYDNTAHSSQEFILRAHQALKQAKLDGGNRYSSATKST